MITYEEALSQIISHAQAASQQKPTQTLPLLKALGKVMARPIISPFPSPRFSQSAVDGYGLNTQTPLTGAIPVIDEIQAGSFRAAPIPPGTAVRIFTGAPIPPGVDAVVMQEDCQAHTDTTGTHVTIMVPPQPTENIRAEGEEYPAGECLLLEGNVITPPVIALMASVGMAECTVFSPPRVSILSTGNELVQPGTALAPGQIYDSNSPALEAALRAMGIETIGVFAGIPDDPETLRLALETAFAQSDVVLTLGGVSVGEYDFVKAIYAELGVTEVFWKIAIKPGKPVYFGTRTPGPSIQADSPSQLVFGLPGNPVAVMVTFHELVKPALGILMGRTDATRSPRLARLAQSLKKKPGRMEWVRGVLEGERVLPTVGQDSHMISGLVKANSLIRFDTEASLLNEGEAVRVTPLQWTP